MSGAKDVSPGKSTNTSEAVFTALPCWSRI